MSDREELITSLRQLARFLHDDFTIGEEAADVIEELQAKLDEKDNEIYRLQEFDMDTKLLKMCITLRERNFKIEAESATIFEHCKTLEAENARLRASIADAIDYLDTAEGGNADEVLRNALKGE